MFRLMDSWKPVAAGLAMLSLAACAGTQLDAAKSVQPSGGAFSTNLYKEYIALAQAEFDEGDYMDADVFASRAMAAAAGSIAALILTQLLYKKPDLTMILNGALAGLVSITAEPLAPSLFGSLLIGAIGGVIVVVTVPLLDKLKIDDVVGAIPVHLFAGIWGTIAVAFSGSATLGAQMTGAKNITLKYFLNLH